MNALAQSAVFGLVAVPSLSAGDTTGRNHRLATIGAHDGLSLAWLLGVILRNLTHRAAADRRVVRRRPTYSLGNGPA
jgi:hypothetical protein